MLTFTKLQYVFNPANPLLFYRQNVAVVLGTWHPYKVANENLFYKFLDTFLAPAYHSLFPGHKVKARPRLSHLEDFFGQLSAAYPSFRNRLLQAYANCPVGHPFKSDIQNLHDLFEFFLPLVSFINIIIFSIMLCLNLSILHFFFVGS